MTVYDAVVVGAGPAGLTAATYLARFRRSVLVLENGRSRARWIPQSHNTPGFPQGLSGSELLARLRAQALEFGAEVREGWVDAVSPESDGFRVTGSHGEAAAHAVILATGIVDQVPPIAGVEAAIQESLVRMCPICDAYEAIDKRIAVLGDGPLALREADFLRTYSAEVAILALRGDGEPSADALAIDLEAIRFVDGRIRLTQPGQAERIFDHLYLALGCAAQSALASALGAATDDTGNLSVDAHQMTSVPGLYAAGDVVRGLNQIAVATGEAAITATGVHNRLRRSAT
jgi:thioredoxin reductase (NADPH)